MENENTSLEVINKSSLLNLSKSEMRNVIDVIISRVNDGEADPLHTFLMAKKGAELFKQLVDATKPIAEDHTKLSKNETYTTYGCDVREQVVGAKYDFTNCDDSQWNDLQNEIDSLIEQRKEREKFLKTITKPIFDEDGIQINPPIKTGALSLVVSIK